MYLDGWDGIKRCEKCGEYTTGRLCTSCARQEMIDNAEGWMGGEYVGYDPYWETRRDSASDGDDNAEVREDGHSE